MKTIQFLYLLGRYLIGIIACFMAGIYIHIPFCKRKCHYCNFFSLATHKYREEFIRALLKEIGQRKNDLADKKIESIYFGGGTPSLFAVDDLKRIIEKLQRVFTISESAEITLEANPDDLNSKYLAYLRHTAINRLSIGIQSFHDVELKYVNRLHSGQDAIDSVKAAQDAGFLNLSVDLIYGIPISTLSSWNKNLDIVKQLNAHHLSAYSLTKEPGTAYDILVDKGKLLAPNDEQSVLQYKMLQSFLPQINMEQYEISNYAANKKYALHNTNYWRGISYLGLGPSAHSFNGESRKWNISHLQKYIQSVENGQVDFEEELLSVENKWNEKIMTGIRTKWGVSLNELEKKFPEEWLDKFQTKADEFISRSWMVKRENYILTDEGKLFADAVAADFFV